MGTGQTDEKRALRKEALVRRDHLTEAQRIKKSGRIAELLFDHPWYQNAELLLVYASYLSEVSTEGIIRHALQTGKRVYCPVVTGKREMMFCEVSLSGLATMGKDSHGIPQPDGKTCAHYDYQPEKSLMLMPGCVFNDQGDRIGYGGGFYDSFLAKQPMRTIALFFDCQHTKAQSVGEPHDVRPDLILTESGFRKIKI
ncbi:MAG: 5-formyltetrahydrofolate cyclo-ligase [Lachnospiraceae bacterium]|nr:5-formyltetrahydrofolate cyclo-ligase [Lachnospiraceae bacterium]MDE7238214.1 5-formyltetrahydrofolate cyclo-ligase [Lachnospiraceae bacterium]